MTQPLELAQIRLLSPTGMGLSEIDQAFSRLMGRTGVQGDTSITYSTFNEFFLPSFKVAGVWDERRREVYNFDKLFDTASYQYEVAEVQKAERQRLAALGLDL